jgi:hypothetical protein
MRGVGGVDGDVMRHSYKWAIKLSPRWVDGYYNLGNLLLGTNQVEKAIERLQVAGVCPVCPMPPSCSCVSRVSLSALSVSSHHPVSSMRVPCVS